MEAPYRTAWQPPPEPPKPAAKKHPYKKSIPDRLLVTTIAMQITSNSLQVAFKPNLRPFYLLLLAICVPALIWAIHITRRKERALNALERLGR